MLIKTIDLICISEGAKALKQKTVLFKNNMLYGLDNINGYLIYTSLVGKIQDDFSYDQGIIINQRELSSFIKSILSESEFNINDYGNTILETSLGEQLHVTRNIQLSNMVDRKVREILSLSYGSEQEITNNILGLFSMKKGDGTMYYIHEYNNIKYFITLFSGLLPLNKADKVFIRIFDNGNSFVSNFIVRKKKFELFIYVAYLKV